MSLNAKDIIHDLMLIKLSFVGYLYVLQLLNSTSINWGIYFFLHWEHCTLSVLSQDVSLDLIESFEMEAILKALERGETAGNTVCN